MVAAHREIKIHAPLQAPGEGVDEFAVDGVELERFGAVDFPAREPALAVRDLTGVLRAWIEVGAPDAARVHKASKAAPRVAVYTHKDAAKLAERWRGERIHRAGELELYAVDPAFVSALVASLQRRMTFALSVTSGHLYIALGERVIEGSVQRREWQDAGA